jgi:hypothetical protein
MNHCSDIHAQRWGLAGMDRGVSVEHLLPFPSCLTIRLMPLWRGFSSGQSRIWMA